MPNSLAANSLAEQSCRTVCREQSVRGMSARASCQCLTLQIRTAWRARIRSCSGGAVSVYLEVLPIAHNLRIANSHLTWELRFRLGIQVMPSSNAGGRCPCGEVLRATRDADHALVCPKNSGVRMLRHDHLNRVWCGAARCAGVATAVEPKLRVLQMQPGVRRHAQAREEARGDALLAMPEGMLVLDVNIVHAPAVALLEGTVATGSSADVARQRRSGRRTRRTSTAATSMAERSSGCPC